MFFCGFYSYNINIYSKYLFSLVVRLLGGFFVVVVVSWALVKQTHTHIYMKNPTIFWSIYAANEIFNKKKKIFFSNSGAWNFSHFDFRISVTKKSICVCSTTHIFRDFVKKAKFIKNSLKVERVQVFYYLFFFNF